MGGIAGTKVPAYLRSNGSDSEATAATQKQRQRLGRKGSDKDQGVGAKGTKVATFRHVIGANVWGDAERSRSQRE